MEGAIIFFGEKMKPRQLFERLQCVSLADRRVLRPEVNLQRLNQKFNLANSPSAELDVHRRLLREGDLFIDLLFQRPDLFHSSLPEWFTVEKGNDPREKLFPQGAISSRRPGFEEREPLPGLPARGVVASIALKRLDDEPLFPFGSEP